MPAQLYRRYFEYETDQSNMAVVQIAYEVGLQSTSPEERLELGGFGEPMGMWFTDKEATRRRLVPRHIMYQFAVGPPQRVFVRTRGQFDELIQEPKVCGYIGEQKGKYRWKPVI